MRWLESRMTLVWLVYFSMAELLSLMPSQAASCILINEEANTENYSGDYACASMHEAIFRFAKCIYANASHDNIAALGSVAVAVFTYTLWRSTHNLWETTRESVIATKQAAEALPSIERAYVFITPELEAWDPVTDPSHGVYNSRYSVKFSIYNHGKTPAVIKLIDAKLRVLSEPPDNDISMASLLPDKVLAAGESFTPDLSPRGCDVDEDAAVELDNNRAQIWFYGSIWYDDMFGKEHVTRFRWSRSEIFDAFIPRGDAPYNERT